MKSQANYNTITPPPPRNPSLNENGGGCLGDIEDFEGILQLVGSYGKYQKRFVYGILMPLCFLLPVFISNTIFLYTVPDHWCHLDEPKNSNMTSFAELKNMSIPREIGPDGLSRFSQCKMYASLENRTEVACQNGWDYDRSEFKDTIPSHFNWVCDDAKLVAQAQMADIVGSFLGTFIFGWVGDKWGRKPTFFVCCFLISVFRFVSLWLPGTLVLFLVSEMIATASFPTIFLAPCSIAIEILDKDKSSWIYGLRLSVWTCGLCFLSLVSWMFRDWFTFGKITSLPLLLVFCIYELIPESPRWLLTQNKLKEAEIILNQIARTNGKDTYFRPEDLERLLVKVKAKQDEQDSRKHNWSIRALFSKRKLAINTTLITISVSANAIISYGISYRSTGLAGNPFLNFLLLTIVELPAGFIGGYFADKVGRRWTITFAFFACALGFGMVMFGTKCPNYAFLVVPFLMVVRFVLAITSAISPLQSAEIFPTDHRANGIGFANGFGQFINILTPSIILLAQSDAFLSYGLFLVVALIGTMAASFLPETVHSNLPETVEEANSLGEGVPYWSFPPNNSNGKRTI